MTLDNSSTSEEQRELYVLAATHLTWEIYGDRTMALLEAQEGPLSDKEKRLFEKAFGAGVITILSNVLSEKEELL